MTLWGRVLRVPTSLQARRSLVSGEKRWRRKGISFIVARAHACVCACVLCRADRCHVRLYEHPARNRFEKLQQYYEAQLATHTTDDDNKQAPAEEEASSYTPFVYHSGDVDIRKENEQCRLQDTEPNGFKRLSDDEKLEGLIAEVERNGYGEDLVTSDGRSLLTVVDRKLAHPRCIKIQAALKTLFEKSGYYLYTPLTRADMLAVILYT